MYSRNRFQIPRTVPYPTPRHPEPMEEKEQLHSIPAPNLPEHENKMPDNVRRNDIGIEEISGGERFFGSNKPLFTFFNTRFYLDDLIILGVIVLLVSEKRYHDDDFILPVLIYLLLGGKVF